MPILNKSLSIIFSLKKCFLYILCLGRYFVGYAQPFYVDPVKGLDTYNCSFATPFQTLTRAQTAVRQYLSTQSTGLKANLYVFLRGGTFPLSATLNFSSVDGGSNGFYRHLLGL